LLALQSIDIHKLTAIEQVIFVEKDESIVLTGEYYRQSQLEEPKTISLLDLGNLNQLLLVVASKNFWIMSQLASSCLMATAC
jgi:hypothetical protein